MNLEAKIRLEPGSKEWCRILYAELPHKELRDDDLVLVPRFATRYGKYTTKREYEADRKRILSTPLL